MKYWQLLAICSGFLCAACVTGAGDDELYLDKRGINEAKYRADLGDCQKQNEHIAKMATERQAKAGASEALGVLAAIGGQFLGMAGAGPAVAITTGAGAMHAGTSTSVNEQGVAAGYQAIYQENVRKCMMGKGYRSLAQ